MFYKLFRNWTDQLPRTNNKKSRTMTRNELQRTLLQTYSLYMYSLQGIVVNYGVQTNVQ